MTSEGGKIQSPTNSSRETIGLEIQPSVPLVEEQQSLINLLDIVDLLIPKIFAKWEHIGERPSDVPRWLFDQLRQFISKERSKHPIILDEHVIAHEVSCDG